MERTLSRVWYGGTGAAPLLPLAPLLRPLAWAYGAAVRLRREAYARHWARQHGAGRPLVIIGNLTVGGTGKTPLVAWLAAQLSGAGYAVGIVSRGYGRAGTAPRVVEPNARWQEVGDEPLLLRRRTGCTTIVAADRVAGARALVAHGAQVIVADDGLQHLPLARDCEILVVDGTRGFGNGRLLPAGPLREPVARAARADVVVCNGPPRHASLAALRTAHHPVTVEMSLVPAAAVPVRAGGAARALESFRGRAVHAVAGIGNPQRFFAELRGAGLEIIEHPFADHHAFRAADLEFGDPLPVLMTEKDAVKCDALAHDRVWYVPVAAHFTAADAQALLSQVAHRLGISVDTRG